jgi:hypothetical protein
MKGIFTAFCLLLYCFTGNAQETAEKSKDRQDLFEANDILELVLKGNIKAVTNDRDVNSQYHPLQLIYAKPGGEQVALPVDVKTRGHFRKLKGNCVYPPLLLNFSKTEALKSSIFKGQSKLKLVMPCVGDDYVVREWLVYKLYNLVTPYSFKARLVKVKLEDSLNKKTVAPFYGLLLEEEKEMAKRNGQIPVERKLLKPEQTYEEVFLNMSVFQYMIGNTDWSVQYQQNIKLIAEDSTSLIPIPVPYDFDHSGLVNAPYARPTEELEMNTVRDRRYRGYCIRDMKTFDSAIALFNRLKDDFYKTYTGCNLLDDKYKKSTLKYLDEFYLTINNASEMKKAFGYPCDPSGTGNVIIKGMKE